MRQKLVAIGDDFFIENAQGQKVFKVDGVESCSLTIWTHAVGLKKVSGRNPMKIKLLFFLVWVLIALSLLLAACGGETPQPAPTPAATPQAEETPEPEATGSP
jgi:hypothetical protein